MLRALFPILVANAAVVAAKGFFLRGPTASRRHFFLTLNSHRFLYYSDSYIGATGAVVANYVTARAELSLNSSTVLPTYLPAYVGSPAEDEVRRRIWEHLPNRRECTVPLRNVVVSGLSRTQVVFRVLAPAQCAAPEDDVDAAITAALGTAVDRELVSSTLLVHEQPGASNRELCAAGFAECGAGPHCAWRSCGSGHCSAARGDYLCSCHESRSPIDNVVTARSGVRCAGPARTCTCVAGGTCSVGGCTCMSAFINRSGAACARRHACAELAPCAWGTCAAAGVHFRCTCLAGFQGARCDTLSAAMACAGLATLALAVGVTVHAARRCTKARHRYDRV